MLICILFKPCAIIFVAFLELLFLELPFIGIIYYCIVWLVGVYGNHLSIYKYI